MKKALLLFLLAVQALAFATDETWLATFTPPAGWGQVDPKTLQKDSPLVKVMVVKPGKNCFPPSLNLALIPHQGTLKEFLQQIKRENRADGILTTDLGPFQTEAGPAHLCTIDLQTEWGPVQEMHLLFLHKNTLYLLTAAALKTEFLQHHDAFYQAFRSFNFRPPYPIGVALNSKMTPICSP